MPPRLDGVASPKQKPKAYGLTTKDPFPSGPGSGPALQKQVRQQRGVTRATETKAVQSGRIAPQIALPVRPVLKSYTPAQRKDIIASTTKAIAKGGTVDRASQLQDARRLGDTGTRRALNKLAGAVTTVQRDARLPTAGERQYFTRGDAIVNPVTVAALGTHDATALLAQRQRDVTSQQHIDNVFNAAQRRALTRPGRMLPGTWNVDHYDPQAGHGKDLSVTKTAPAEAMDNATKRLTHEMQTAGVDPATIAAKLGKLKSEHKSPADFVLQQFTRPASAIAGAVQDHSLSAGVKGFLHNNRSFRESLGPIGGLVADTVLDPTTYATVGVGAPAMAEARAVQLGRLAEGASEREALAAAKATYDASAHQAAGARIGLRGVPVRAVSLAKQALRGRGDAFDRSVREVATSGKLTSRINHHLIQPTGRALAHGLSERTRKSADAAMSDLFYAHRPADIHPVDFQHITDAAREYRAMSGHAERVAARRGRAYEVFAQKHELGNDAQWRVMRALERRSGAGLARDERRLYGIASRDLNDIGKAEVKAGVRAPHELIGARPAKPGEPVGYAPRVPRSLLEDTPGGVRQGVAGARGRTKIGGTAFNARSRRLALEHQDPAEMSQKYIHDNVAVPMTMRIQDSGLSLGMARFHNRLGAMGVPIQDAAHLDGMVPFIRDRKGFKLVEKPGIDTPADVERKVTKAISNGDQVVGLPQHVYDTAWEQAQRGRGSAASHVGMRGFDRLQGTVKTGQTVINPGYHLTNLIGDTFNSRLAGTTSADFKAALRLLVRERKVDTLDRDLARSVNQPSPLGPGKTEFYKGLGKEASDATVVGLARTHGAIQMGFAGHELRTLMDAVRGGKSLGIHPLDAVRRFSEYREDLARLATFRGALKRGMDPAEAARVANRHHFDYSNLTTVERGALRRMIPFYTFVARNAPLQAKSLLMSPGRYATLQKVRNAGSQEAGLPQDWVTKMPSYVQEQLPVAIPGKVGGVPLSVNTKLPATDLNLIDPRGWPDQFAQRMTTLAKLPLELKMRYDFFANDKVRHKLVPAPTWAMDPHIRSILESLPGNPKITTIRDRTSGKMVAAWPWWVDKMVRTLPIAGAVANAATPGKNIHAGGLLGLSGTVLGPRVVPVDLHGAQTQQLFEQLDKIDSQLQDLQPTVPNHRSGQKWGGKIGALNKSKGKVMKQIAKLGESEGMADPYFSHAKKGKQPKYFGGAGGARRSSKPHYFGGK